MVWSNNSVKGPKVGQKRFKARRGTFQSVDTKLGTGTYSTFSAKIQKYLEMFCSVDIICLDFGRGGQIF